MGLLLAPIQGAGNPWRINPGQRARRAARGYILAAR